MGYIAVQKLDRVMVVICWCMVLLEDNHIFGNATDQRQHFLQQQHFSLHFALVVDDAKCIVVTRVCVSVCLSAAVRPHYCTDPDVTWGHGRGCPLVVHYWVDLLSVHGLRCYGNITRTLIASLRPFRDMTT